MAALLIDCRPGDEIIMPSYTFVSTANAFVLRGGVPVFVDIRPDTQNIDETLIEAAITDRTRAICVVHYAGVACEMDAIMEIAERHRLYVIEDAAQGVGSCYRGRRLGSIGHLGCYSFHETKNVISGEGGALLVNDPSLMERAEIIREKGPTVPGFPRAGGQIHLGGRRFLLSARRDDRRLFVCPAGTRAGNQRGKVEVVEYVPPRSGSIGRTGGAAASVRSGALHA